MPIKSHLCHLTYVTHVHVIKACVNQACFTKDIWGLDQVYFIPRHTSETMKHKVEWNDVKKDVAKWQGVVATANQHPYWWVTFRLLSKISYEAQKMLDLDSETLIYNKHG
jgi:hypothetical protein